MRLIRFLAPVLALGLISGCSMFKDAPPSGKVLVVDELGTPLAGAVILFDESSGNTNIHEIEEAPKSDASGMIAVDLEPYLWESDSCYHFRVRCHGYDDASLTVSRDLLPPVLRVELKVRGSFPGAAPSPRSAPSS